MDSSTTHNNFSNATTQPASVTILNGISWTAGPSVFFYNGHYDIGSSTDYKGTLTIDSGGTYNSGATGVFYNGFEGSGEVNVFGTFNNISDNIFANGIGGAGTVNIKNGGIFNNLGSTFDNNLGSSGTVVIENGGIFNNSGVFDQTGVSTTGSLVINGGGTFNNNATGVFEGGTLTIDSGGTFNHYAGNLFGNDGKDVTITNNGIFNIGYSNPAVATTDLWGTYTQGSTGTLAIRADFATTTSDRLFMDEPTTVAGKVDVTSLNFGAAGPLERTFQGIITTSDSITDNGLTVANPDTAVIDYELIRRTEETSDNIDLRIRVNFQGVVPGGLTPNQNSVGGGLNSAFQGGAMFEFMPVLFGLATNAELANALDQLAPSGTGASSASMMMSGARFAEHLVSCSAQGESDANAIIREGQCVWARATIRHTSFDNGGRTYGADETAPFYSAGAQVNLGGAWRMGGGIGYETSSLDTNFGNRIDTDRLHLGAVLKFNPGPLLLAATVTGAFGWSDSVRNISFGAFTDTVRASYDSDYISGRLTAAYLVPFQGFYLKPQVDVAYMQVSREGYQERDNGRDSALKVASSSDGVWSVIPMLELGTQVRLNGGGIARPFIRGGVTWRDTDHFVTTSTFLNAPDGAPFAVTSAIDDLTANIAAGLDLITPSNTTLRLQYDGQFGDTAREHIGSAKLSVRY